ncbi:protein Spindly-B-like [Oratosquilla oratoria]|uniref:protein Spindly-B-like n=1 Tax=Oratosquilla oratoria TaxID=337810 RepID=UPI003F762DF1
MDVDAEINIAELQRKLAATEENNVLAAMYGKQLLEENQSLHEQLEDTIKEYAQKLEALEQEKYSINLHLESKTNIEKSLMFELEQLRELNNELKSSQEEMTEKHQKDMSTHVQKVHSLEDSLSQAQLEDENSKEQIKLLESQMQELQERINQCNTSLHELSVDETTLNLQNQVITLSQEKQNLETELTSSKNKHKALELSISNISKKLEKKSNELEEKECQLTSSFNALDRKEEEITELKIEIESLRFAETDPRRKGNSLFAEVEDQRQGLEKKVLSLANNYSTLKKQYDLKVQQICKMKLQITSFLNKNTNHSDEQYISSLKDSLQTTKAQLESFANRYKELEKRLSIAPTPSPSPATTGVEGDENSSSDLGNFFKGMYLENQKKLEDLQEQLKEVSFDKLVLNDKILELQQKLRMATNAENTANVELVKLKIKLEEMANNKGLTTDTKKPKEKITEKLPANVLQTHNQNNKSDLSPEEHDLVGHNAKEQTPMNKDDQSHSNSHSCDQKENISSTKSTLVKQQEGNISKTSEITSQRAGKPKKVVQMKDTVEVLDGEIQTQQEMKTTDGGRHLTKTKKKMEAPIVRAADGPAECKQQ